MGKTFKQGRTHLSNRKSVRSSGPTGKQMEFLHELSSADPEMTSSMALQNLHRFIKEHQISNIGSFHQKSTNILRICKICDKWDRLKSIKTCQICEDHYHKSCYEQKIGKFSGKFICQMCFNAQMPTKKCKVCNKPTNQSSLLVECQYCQNEYHRNCMIKNSNICQRCDKVRQNLELKSDKKKIKKEEKSGEQLKSTNRNLRDMFDRIRTEKKSFLSNSKLILSRKTCLFKAMRMMDNQPELISKYRRQLLRVIKEKQMNYTEDLKDIEFHFDHMEQGSMNFGLQNMSPQEENQYNKYKQQPIGPFQFEYSKVKGYGVIAGMDIPKKSIICEYVGEVVTLRQCAELDLIEKNDSVMDLWHGRNSDQKLVIRPQKWTNIARFINGVKNNKSSPNIDSIRVSIRGLPVVLLISRRDIKKGESLCYDYNAGGIPAKYDTSNFVE